MADGKMVVLGLTALALLALAQRPSPPAGVATLDGVIVDAVTMVPIPGVLVTVGSWSGLTDASGVYSVTGITPGIYIIVFSKDGYETMTI
jgi:hypothetical protein